MGGVHGVAALTSRRASPFRSNSERACSVCTRVPSCPGDVLPVGYPKLTGMDVWEAAQAVGREHAKVRDYRPGDPRHAAKNPGHVRAAVTVAALLTDPRTDNDTFGNLQPAVIARSTIQDH